jgi:hypothetical protein
VKKRSEAGQQVLLVLEDGAQGFLH